VFKEGRLKHKMSFEGVDLLNYLNWGFLLC
jgi:hypothetical protein